MKYLAYYAVAMMGYAPILYAEMSPAAPYSFLAGSYVCVGKYPDSDKTYSGRVEISPAARGVKLVRIINGKKTEALGKFGTATADRIPILIINFNEKGVDYEGTCMVSPDLNNYERITCYIYSNKTKKVGLETLFPDHGYLERN